jgi:hypothetical protein
MRLDEPEQTDTVLGDGSRDPRPARFRQSRRCRMSALTTWRTDDPCPVCGVGLYLTDDPAGNPVAQDCRRCGWSTSWQTSGEAAR